LSSKIMIYLAGHCITNYWTW